MKTKLDPSRALDATGRTILAVLAGVFIGGFAAPVVYTLYGMAFESLVIPRLIQPGTPRLSYGQPAMLIMTPLATLLGAGLGASIGFALRTRWWWAATCASVTSSFIGVIVCGLRNDSFSRYGADPSDWILYVPLQIASLVGLSLGLLMVFLAVFCARRHRFTSGAR
jgi:hypothetical protein